MRIEGEKFTVDWLRVLGLGALVTVSGVAAYYLQPLISQKSDAINAVVTIFSILAGFLIAVITLIGDPGARGWKELQMEKADVVARLQRHRIIFYLYLITLGLAFTLFLVPGEPSAVEPSAVEPSAISVWLERAFVFLAVSVFGASFTLPSSLMALQMARFNGALKADLPEALKGK